MKTQEPDILNLLHKQQQIDSEQQKPDETIEKEFKAMKKLATWDLKETTPQEKEKILTTRFSKFYLYNHKKNKALDHFDQKPEVQINHPDIVIDHKKLLVYGIDFMNKKKIQDYFQLKDEKITILNSSSCQITAETHDRIRDILERVINDSKQLDDLNALKWSMLRPYYQQGVERKLQARLGTNKDQIKKTKGVRQFIQDQTKKQFLKQSLRLKNQKLLPFHPRRQQKRNFQIFQKKLDPPENIKFNQSMNNLSFSKNNINNPIEIQSSQQQVNDNISESINNYDHSLSLDISAIHNNSNPHIYQQPKNTHKFNKFNKFSYKEYQKEQQQKQKEKKNDITVIPLDDDDNE